MDIVEEVKEDYEDIAIQEMVRMSEEPCPHAHVRHWMSSGGRGDGEDEASGQD